MSEGVKSHAKGTDYPYTVHVWVKEAFENWRKKHGDKPPTSFYANLVKKLGYTKSIATNDLCVGTFRGWYHDPEGFAKSMEKAKAKAEAEARARLEEESLRKGGN